MVFLQKIKVVHNGIKKRKFLAGAKVKRKRDTLSIAFIGHLSLIKGFVVVHGSPSHPFLNVVGDGLLMRKFEELYS